MSDQDKTMSQRGFAVHRAVGLAIDPIHVGTGGMRLGRVDNTIVRDPVTRVPKIPGSSLAGVYRAYAAMAMEGERTQAAGGTAPSPGGSGGNQRTTPYYPNCAGMRECNQTNCAICGVFGTTKHAGLAAFSDADLVLFPVATMHGPRWVTSPLALERAGIHMHRVADAEKAYVKSNAPTSINLGWLRLPCEQKSDLAVRSGLHLQNGTPCTDDQIVLISDKLFAHVVNSNLEVRTSVAINPETGAADEGKLFTYEALPRGTVLVWDITCRDPRHFQRTLQNASGDASVTVLDVVRKAEPFFEALGVGGMGTRGMGRLKVLSCCDASASAAALATGGLPNGEASR